MCVAHGGAARQVREAAARRWEWERMMARIERKLGRSVDPFTLAWMRAQFPADRPRSGVTGRPTTPPTGTRA